MGYHHIEMENLLQLQLRELRELQERSFSYFPLFLIAMLVAFFIYGYTVCCVTRHQLAQTQRNADSERRRAVAAVAAHEAAEQNINTTIDNLVDGMSPSDREAFVENFLKTDVMTLDRLKKLKISEEVKGEQAVDGSIISSTGTHDDDGAAGSFVSSIREASGFWSAGGDDDVFQRFPHCAICLELLRVNEDIGLSQNLECPHIFHKCCVTEWLMTNKDCPICRRRYLDLAAV